MSVEAKIDAKELEQVWLDAMAAGWVSGSKSEILPRYPHTQLSRYMSPDSRFVVEDHWLSLPGVDASSGETHIYLDGVPVWVMQYYGWYDHLAIPVLKEALSINYLKNRIFFGGRGPNKYECGNVYYFNYPNPGSSFKEFAGREDVMDVSLGIKRGYHRYQGGLLL